MPLPAQRWSTVIEAAAHEAAAPVPAPVFDPAPHKLTRYLNAEKRRPVQVAENICDKYAVFNRELEIERTETLKALNGFLSGLGYLKVRP